MLGSIHNVTDSGAYYQWVGCTDNEGDKKNKDSGYTTEPCATCKSSYGFNNSVDESAFGQVCECWKEYQEAVIKEQYSGQCGCPKGYVAKVILGADNSKTIQCSNPKDITGGFVLNREDGVETSWEAYGQSSSDSVLSVSEKSGKYVYSIDVGACLEETLGISFSSDDLANGTKFAYSNDRKHCYANGYEVKAEFLNNCLRQASTICGEEEGQEPCLASRD